MTAEINLILPRRFIRKLESFLANLRQRPVHFHLSAQVDPVKLVNPVAIDFRIWIVFRSFKVQSPLRVQSAVVFPHP
jgi:hypothetical protein